MKSIKPGRGPSMMGGISALFAALFGVFWIIVVLQSGGGFFAFFGVIFIAMALVQAWYNFQDVYKRQAMAAAATGTGRICWCAPMPPGCCTPSGGTC